MPDNNNYDINFLKPVGPRMKKNIRLIVILVLIWAIGVFGFQFLLKILEEPTPEQAYYDFESVWSEVVDEKANNEEKQKFIRSVVAALSKTSKEDDAITLGKTITCITYDLIEKPEDKQNFLDYLNDISYYKAKLRMELLEREQDLKKIESLRQTIHATEKKVSPIALETMDIGLNSIEKEIFVRSLIIINEVPEQIDAIIFKTRIIDKLNDPKSQKDISELYQVDNRKNVCILKDNLTIEERSRILKHFSEIGYYSFMCQRSQNIKELMNKYLIHNRSVLTDTNFLGFPFHYWYTAEFLLIMFVLLCWTYCFVIDRVYKKHPLETEEDEE